MNSSTVPTSNTKIGSLSGTYTPGKEYKWNLDASKISPNKNFNLIMKLDNGNDTNFFSKNAGHSAPKLVITYIPE